MYKILLSLKLILLFLISIPSYADRWVHSRYRNHYRYHYNSRHYTPIRDRRYTRNYYNTGPGISAGAATAIGLGVGVLGFVIGRSTKSKEVIYKDNSKIECKDFDIRVMIDGEEKKAKIIKCRTEDGEWKIPE
jgi:hypothetical protein